MERGSNQVGPRKDDEMKHELEGYLRSGQHTHVEEGNDPEPPADDDIQVDPGGPVTPPGGEREEAQREADTESLRLELARHLERATFPADRQTLLDALQANHAPDTVLDAVRNLPDGATYTNVTEIAAAVSESRP
ncbi:DUF2795 domain-containing protein [Streptomyces sp. NPDC046939]|uniref:DUF2795 domain-containing protein n=1 Tax=Streptomyces sp. NPDC046939 TaxID=3155376 RepID=UPI0033C01182